MILFENENMFVQSTVFVIWTANYLKKTVKTLKSSFQTTLPHASIFNNKKNFCLAKNSIPLFKHPAKYWQASRHMNFSLPTCEWTSRLPFSSHREILTKIFSPFAPAHSFIGKAQSFIHNINYSFSWSINFYLFFEVQANILLEGKSGVEKKP